MVRGAEIVDPRSENPDHVAEIADHVTVRRSQITSLRCRITLRDRRSGIPRCLNRSFRLVIRVRRTSGRALRHQSTPLGPPNTNSRGESARDARYTSSSAHFWMNVGKRLSKMAIIQVHHRITEATMPETDAPRMYVIHKIIRGWRFECPR